MAWENTMTHFAVWGKPRRTFRPINVSLRKRTSPCAACTNHKPSLDTVEPRFHEVAGDRPNLFVKSRVRSIENLDIMNLRGNDQNVRYIEVIVND